jgi:N-acetyl-alpha-D-muramate 1-phosphate uridylyltransferase
MNARSGSMHAAMILAAGRGERMRPFTDTRPKPLAELCGKPLIQHHVERLAGVGVSRVVINLGWLGAQIRTVLGDGDRFGLKIFYSDEGPAPLETGGGIFRALPLLGQDPFWVISADLWTDYRNSLLEAKPAAGDLAHLMMVPNPDFHPRGDFCLKDGRISEAVGERLTYANIALLHPELFADCRPGVFPLAPLLVAAMRKNRVGGELYSGEWHNIGTLSQLAALESTLRSGM